ncbi:RNA methyltransferase [uncultured Meiothermus sp.]|jgi:TrmH family RNA methyltransferase|uniref:TrmH family RNA methyltransferase n=1 Tax=uncultured Meiothermus sp. TaxID=157471 RepID=UPI0026282DE4|nr:RNA methyltransferase [uncultured Meiothermus sp.]
MRITSTSNPHIKAATALMERKERVRTGLFLMEGSREVERALAAGIEIIEAYRGERLDADEARVVAKLGRLERVEIVEVSEPVLKKLSSRENPAGVVVVARMPKPSLWDFVPPKNALVLVSVGLEKPGNLGALLRSADAAGADAVLVAGGVDLYSPQVIRNSTGVVFLLPTFAAPEQAVLDWLRQYQIPLVATTPHTDKTYWDVDLCGPVAIVLGTEHQGLSGAWLDRADLKVKIPMQGQADSLNVSVTSALMLYEVKRQRRSGSIG